MSMMKRKGTWTGGSMAGRGQSQRRKVTGEMSR